MSTPTRGRGRPPGPPLDVDKRREQLLDAAEVAIGSNGPDVSLADIATTAGLTRSAVYAVFSDRQALIASLGQRHARRIVDRMRQILSDTDDPEQQTRATIDILAAWFEDEPALARLLLHRLDDPADGQSGIVDVLAEILTAGFADRGLDTAPAQTWAHCLVGAVSATVQWWAQNPTMDRTELVDHVTALIWGGFSGAPARSGTPEK